MESPVVEEYLLYIRVLNVVVELVCVCKEQSRHRKPLQHAVVVELIHVEFREFEHCEPHIEGPIDPESHFLALDSAELVSVDARIHELRSRD